MSSKLNRLDYISRYGFFLLFIFYYSFPALHSFIEIDGHHRDLNSCSALNEGLDEYECLLHSKHQSECSHAYHVHKSTVDCELCALVYSLKITSASLEVEKDVLSDAKHKAQLLNDELGYASFQSTQNSRGPPLFF